MKAVFPVLLALGLAACSNTPFAPKDRATGTALTGADATRPQARPGALRTRVTAPPPPPTARTEEAFDTTTAEQRAEAAATPEPQAERRLGETVASLGDVTRSGFWLETPLVDTAVKGRVLYPSTGKSSQVDLIPIEGPATGGSRISLAAMRLIGAPLTDLPTLEVFAGG